MPIKLARKLGVNLGSGLDSDFFSSETIQQGMTKAIENLLLLTRDFDGLKKQFLYNCSNRGVDKIDFPQHLEENLKYIIHFTNHLTK